MNKFQRLISLGLLAAILAIVAGPAWARVVAVDAVGMPVSDMDRSLRFFTEVLDFKKVSDEEIVGEPYEKLHGVFGLRARVVRLTLGDEAIELTQYLAPEGRPMPGDTRSNDRWFQHIAIVVSDMAKAYQHLRRHNVRHASTGPQRLPDWNPNAGGIEAFYFKDPDGHHLEIIAFPPGKGDPRWQEPTDNLFLGIDHTAIVVADTEASLKFYRDQLGLRVAGASENHGTEQEHLNNVFGARLRITGLRADRGLGIEFLEYLAPSDGRPYLLDSRANDIWNWQTRLVVDNAAESADELLAAQASFVSPGPVELPTESSKGFQVRDPDGHALLLLQD